MPDTGSGDVLRGSPHAGVESEQVTCSWRHCKFIPQSRATPRSSDFTLGLKLLLRAHSTYLSRLDDLQGRGGYILTGCIP